MTELLDDPTPDEPSEPLEESEPAVLENASTTALPQRPSIPETRARPSEPRVRLIAPQADAAPQSTITNPRVASIRREFPDIPSIPSTAGPDQSIYTQPLPFAGNSHHSYKSGQPLPQRSLAPQPSVAASSDYTSSRRPVTTDGRDPAANTGSQGLGGIQAAQTLHSVYAAGPTSNAAAMAPLAPTNSYAIGATPNALIMPPPSAPTNPYISQAAPAQHHNFTYVSPYVNTAPTGVPTAAATRAPPILAPAQTLSQPLGQNVGLPVPQNLNLIITALRALPKVGSTDHPERKMLKKPYEGSLTNASPAEREIREHFFGGSGKLKEDSQLGYWYGDLNIFSAEMWEFLMVQKPRPGGI